MSFAHRSGPHDVIVRTEVEECGHHAMAPLAYAGQMERADRVQRRATSNT